MLLQAVVSPDLKLDQAISKWIKQTPLSRYLSLAGCTHQHSHFTRAGLPVHDRRLESNHQLRGIIDDWLQQYPGYQAAAKAAANTAARQQPSCHGGSAAPESGFEASPPSQPQQKQTKVAAASTVAGASGMVGFMVAYTDGDEPHKQPHHRDESVFSEQAALQHYDTAVAAAAGGGSGSGALVSYDSTGLAD